MKEKKVGFVIANFGGPRNLQEVQPFLEALLTDKDVVRTKIPNFINKILFKRVAKKRTVKISKDYQKIGGRSPIYEDTEAVANDLKHSLKGPILTFHRYLPATHSAFLKDILSLECDEIRVFPMFPQFTYATVGSIARWFEDHLPIHFVNKLRWIKSYPTHPTFIQAHQMAIRRFLDSHQLKDKETILLFSAHGVPQQFIEEGDLYEDECRASFRLVIQDFPEILGRLCYQSRFGPEEWIKPYTIDVCQGIKTWNENRQNIVFVPLSFTSDHIETLFEVEEEYMSVIRDQGLKPFRVPALTRNAEWLKAIVEILNENNFCNTQMLVRKGLY